MGTTATPTVTVDMVLFKQNRQILLIQRRKPPYQNSWALPGGKLDTGESVEQAAQRELREETGITDAVLHQAGVFSNPQRDPRGHFISVAFYGVVEPETCAVAGDDANAAQWFSLSHLPPLAFDHEQIIQTIIENVPR